MLIDKENGNNDEKRICEGRESAGSNNKLSSDTGGTPQCSEFYKKSKATSL